MLAPKRLTTGQPAGATGPGAGFALSVQSAAPKRRVQAGKTGEDLVEAALESCERAGLVRAFRVPNDWQVVSRRGPHALCVPRRRSGPDYLGVLAGGRLVALEVKHVSGTRLVGGELGAVRFPLDDLAPHQLVDLRTIERLGGLAFVVVVHGDPRVDGAFYRIPVSVVSDAVVRAAKSLVRADLDPCRVPRGVRLLEGLS